MSTRVLKWVLIGLVAANLLVAAAWWAKDDLVKAGLLGGPPERRVDLAKLPLPPIEVVEPEEEPAPVVNEDAASPPDSAETPPELDEAPAPAAEADSSALADLAEPRAAPPTTLTCVVAGPFEDKSAAKSLAARFEAAGGTAQVDAETVEAPPKYLVFVAPASKQAAARTWQELTAREIDAYVIPRGARANGVSVGVFSVQDRAVAQRDRVAALGHSVLIHQQSRTRTVYRVVGRGVPDEGLVDAAVVPCEGDEAETR